MRFALERCGAADETLCHQTRLLSEDALFELLGATLGHVVVGCGTILITFVSMFLALQPNAGWAQFVHMAPKDGGVSVRHALKQLHRIVRFSFLFIILLLV